MTSEVKSLAHARQVQCSVHQQGPLFLLQVVSLPTPVPRTAGRPCPWVPLVPGVLTRGSGKFWTLSLFLRLYPPSPGLMREDFKQA